jgi:DNA modification methylase
VSAPFYADGQVTLHQGDVRGCLREMPDESVQMCVTSPPYWGLRDYGVPGQLGLEATPEAYVAAMVDVFSEVKRVLCGEGTLWLNLGDSYAGSWGAQGHFRESTSNKTTLSRNQIRNHPKLAHHTGTVRGEGLKAKDLVGIPWLMAFALRADGWYLRSDIIWSKPNPMPESVTDRPTKAHEYLFLLSKSARYYYDADAIREPGKNYEDDVRRVAAQHTANKSTPDSERNGLRVRHDKQRGHGRRHAGFNERWDVMSKDEQGAMGRNKRSVWTIATQPYPEAHFATFPEELVRPCVLAGSREGDTILDPFLGSGTTAWVAKSLGRRAIGIDLSADYLELAVKRNQQMAMLGGAAS